MNKKLSWLCMGILVLTVVGCDCIRIKRLAGERHTFTNSFTHFHSKDQEEPLEFTEESEINITNEGSDRVVDITNEVGSDGDHRSSINGSKNTDGELGDDGMGGSVVPGGRNVGRRTPNTSRKIISEQTNSPSVRSKKLPKTDRRESSQKKISTRLRWIIYTEYPAQEEIAAPETVLLDGVEVEQGDEISSGSHQIIVEHPGHETLRKTIVVPVATKVYTFKGTMATLPRGVESQITYDRVPPASLGDTSITLTSQRTGKAISIDKNTSVKPGEYQLQINKRGYLPVNKTVRIYPIRSTYNIEEMLQAKSVKIRTIVNYDVVPPANLQSPVAVFIGRSIQQRIIDGGSIKPGNYTYKITQPGYRMQGSEKQIEILPSEEVYTIRENMNVQPRPISFEIEKDGFLVPFEEIFIDGESVSFDKTFVPGRQYRLVAKFRQYQTVEKTITVTPGEGPYRLNIQLIRK